MQTEKDFSMSHITFQTILQMGPRAWDVKKWCVFSLHVFFFFFCKRLLLLPKLIFTQREQRSPEDTRVRRGRREWTKTMMGSEERTLTPSRDSPSWVSYGPDHVALLPAHYRWGRGRRRSRERRLRVKPTDLIHSLLIGRRAAFSFSRTCKGGGFSHEAFLALSLYLLHLGLLADDLTVRSDTKSEC